MFARPPSSPRLIFPVVPPARGWGDKGGDMASFVSRGQCPTLPFTSRVMSKPVTDQGLEGGGSQQIRAGA